MRVEEREKKCHREKRISIRMPGKGGSGIDLFFKDKMNSS